MSKIRINVENHMVVDSIWEEPVQEEYSAQQELLDQEWEVEQRVNSQGG